MKSWQHLTRHLVSSKRHLYRADVVIVDKAGPCLQVLSHAMGSRNVPVGGGKEPTFIQSAVNWPHCGDLEPQPTEGNKLIILKQQGVNSCTTLLTHNKLTWWRPQRPVQRWCCWLSWSLLPPCQKAKLTWQGQKSPPSHRSCRLCSYLCRETLCVKKQSWVCCTTINQSVRHTKYAWWHEISPFQFGVTGDKGISSTKHSGSLEINK